MSRARAHRLIAAAWLLFYGATGCMMVGPDYVIPDLQTPNEWSKGQDAPQASRKDPTREELSRWWNGLADPVLVSLIEQAVNDNLDVQEAMLRVAEARARRGVAAADLYPQLDGGGSARRTRSERGETRQAREQELYEVGLDAAWELDLFGGIRRSVESAEAEVQASEASLYNVLVILAAEVALSYTELRTFEQRLRVAEANLTLQEEAFELAQYRYQAGLATALDLEQARYNLEDTRSRVPGIRSALSRSRHRLAVLLGRAPGNLVIEGASARIPQVPLEVAIGVPADILRRRPDLRQAERTVAAATARVGVATADLYPRFNLLGSIGLESLSAGDLLTNAGTSYTVGPTITWPIFNAGAVRQNIRVQTTLQEQAFVRYESVLLSALEEVENALIAFAEEQRTAGSLSEATRSAREASELALQQYSTGLVDFRQVLEAQRTLYSFEDRLAESRGRVVLELIRLYKALGGGWEPLREEPGNESAKESAAQSA